MSYLQPFASASCRFNAAMISKIVFSAVLLAVAAATPYRDCGKKNRPTLCSFASTELEPGFCADVSRINGDHLFVRRSRLHYSVLYHRAFQFYPKSIIITGMKGFDWFGTSPLDDEQITKSS